MGGIAWTREEDQLLRRCIERHGEGKWHRIPRLAGLNRCRKSCRLRWLNYLRPNIKRGNFTNEEVEHIIELHGIYGNKWSLIASKLENRTGNDVKNYWNCHLRKRLQYSYHNIESSQTTHNKCNDHQCQWNLENSMEVTKQVPAVSSCSLHHEFFKPCHLQDESQDFDQTVLEQEDHGKDSYTEEDKMILQDHDLPHTNIDYLEGIKLKRGSELSVCKWDLDSFTFDVELWTHDSL